MMRRAGAHALRTVVAVAFVAAPWIAHADDDATLTVRQVADRVVAAFDAKNDKALRKLASLRGPFPWQVADVLVRRKAYDAALAFARAAPGAGTRRLPAYVEARRAAGPDEAAWARWLAVQTGHAKQDWPVIVKATEDLPPADSTTDARLRWMRGVALREMRRLPESAKALVSAAKACEQLGWLRFASECWHESAKSAYFADDLKAARTAWQGRLAVVRKIGEPLPIAGTLNNLGMVADSGGDVSGAIAFYEQALGFVRKARRADRERDILNNLGVTFAALGRYAEALAHYERALALHEKADDRAGMAATLHNLAAMEHRLGRLPDALKRYARALALERERANTRGTIETLLSLGAVRVAANDEKGALSAFNEARDLAQGARNRHLEGRALHSLAGLHFGRERMTEALALYTAAERIARDGNDPLARARTLIQIARVQVKQKQPQAAFPLLAEARSLLGPASQFRLLAVLDAAEAQAHLRSGAPKKAVALARDGVMRAMRIGRGLAEGEGASARDDFAFAFRVGVDAAFEARDLHGLSWFIERDRADSLREGLATRAALQDALLDPHLASALQAAQRSERDALRHYRDALQANDRKRRRATRRRYASARDAVEHLLARVQREAKASAAILLPEAHELERIRADLRPAEALVLYAFGAKRAVALVVRPGGARAVSLGNAKELRVTVARLLGHAKRHVDTTYEKAARERLVDPLQLPSDVKHVLLSPTGSLGYVPFGLLFKTRSVRYMASGTILGLLRAQVRGRGKDVLALGDPVYPPTARLDRLDGTRTEVEAVGTVKLLGPRATESALREALPLRTRWRAIHFACHGLIDASRPMFSSLALTPDTETDGLLNCLDLFRLAMPADLVVLSACDTAKGKIYRTEGIVGMTRGFQHAGASQVLCSQWRVDDEATRALMVKFYSLWNPKDGSPRVDAATALRQAQAHVAAQPDWDHPYFWAAWTLWGL